MNERNQILDYIVDLIKNNSTLVKTVSRQFRPIDQYRLPELPAVAVLDGMLTRIELNMRNLFEFEVIVRIICYDEKRVSEKLNNITDEILNLLDTDHYLGGNSIKPISLIRIDTDEGWLSPFAIADIRIKTFFTSCRRI